MINTYSSMIKTYSSIINTYSCMTIKIRRLAVMAGRRVLRCSAFCILSLLLVATCGHVLLSFSISRNFIGMAKVVRCRFQRSRLQYYRNSTSSFNLPKLQIILSIDICPQPGTTNESISFYYQSARSLKAFALNDDGAKECKLILLKDIVYGSDFHLIAITETWLKPCIFDSEILPHGYEVLRKDRDVRAGGGVLFQ